MFSDLDQSAFVREDHELCPVAEVELGQDARYVRRDGRGTDEKSPGDLGVGEAAGHADEDVLGLPMALQDMVLAGWLIIRGFRPVSAGL